MAPTRDRRYWLNRAVFAIANCATVMYDVAAMHGQMVGNVQHMQWFVEAVAQELAGDRFDMSGKGGRSHAPRP
jgi:hypothetical protein